MAELLNLSTTVSAQSDAFIRGIENCRGGLRNLIASLDPVAQATDRFNRNMGTLDRALAQNKISTQEYGIFVDRLRQRLNETVGDQGRVTASTGQLRAGMQQLSYQIGDVSQGFAVGTPFMTIFAQQSGQVIQSLQLMTNSTKGFIGFLAGPWGAVLTGAATVAATFGLSLLKVGDNADDTTKRINGVTDALERLRREQGNEADIAVGEGQLNELRDQRLLLLRRVDQIDRLGLDPRLAAEVQKRLAAVEEKIKAQQSLVNFNRANQENRARDTPPRAAPAARVPSTSTFRATVAKPLVDEAQLALDDLKKRLEATLAGVFTDETQIRNLQQQMGTLDAAVARGLINPATWQAAQMRLADQITEIREKMNSITVALPPGMEEARTASLKAITAQFQNVGKGAEQAGAAMVQMATDSLNALSNLANSIKSGGILNILTDTFNLFGQLAKSGIFGGKLETGFANFIGLSGFRADGGPVSGGKSYIVGERGPELFTPNRSGYVVANDDMPGRAGGGTPVVIKVQANDYFDAKVAGISHSVAAPIGMRAAQAGSNDAQRTFATRQKNRIPGR